MKALEKVSGHTRLYRRGAVYYHRAAVPTDIAETYGKREETFSLKTKDHREALRKVRVAAVEIDAKFETHRRWIAANSSPKLDELTKEQLQRIKSTYYHHLLDENDDTRDEGFEKLVWDEIMQGPPKPFRRKSFDEQREINDLLPKLSREDMAQGEDRTGFFKDEAEEVLTWGGIGIRLEESSTSWPRLIRTLQEASIEASEVISRRLQGEIVPTPDDPNELDAKPLSAPLLSALVEQWIGEKKASDAWLPKAENDYRRWLETFMAVCRDKPVTNYEKSDARDFKNHIIGLPANWRKYVATRHASVLEAPMLGKAAGLEPISVATVNKALGRLDYFWQWIEAHYDDVTPNLFNGLKIAKRTKAADDRHPFSPEQLQSMFSSPLFVGCKSSTQRNVVGHVNMAGTAHYWLPILGLFTGARLNELCQLQITDVKDEEGILFVNITDDANDQRVKTAGSKRRCPIHSTIEMLGFRDFYEWRKASGEKLLFKEVKLSKDGYYSDGMSKAFGRFLKAIKVKTKKTSFHSFRHNLEDACLANNGRADILDALQGHSTQGMRGRYGTGDKTEVYQLRTLKETIECVEYPSINFEKVNKFV